MTNLGNNTYEADDGKIFFTINDVALGSVIYLGINDSIDNYVEKEPIEETTEEDEESVPDINSQIEDLQLALCEVYELLGGLV